MTVVVAHLWPGLVGLSTHSGPPVDRPL